MDIEKIEQLTHDIYHNAEITPPTNAWDKISQRMAAPQPMPQSKSHKGLWWSVGTASALILAVALITLQPNSDPASLSQTNELVANIPTSNPSQQSSLSSEVDSRPVVETLSSTPTPQSSATTSSIDKSAKVLTPSEPQQQTIAIPQSTEPKAHDLSTPAKTTPEPTIVTHTEKSKPASQPSPTPKTSSPTSVIQPSSTSVHPQTASSSPKSEPVQTASTASPSLNIAIPNLISPNFDGINDCWIINDLSQYSDVHVQIFTAKSKKIYENSHYNNQFCGDDLPDGQYFYVISVRSINFSRRGVLIIRR